MKASEAKLLAFLKKSPQFIVPIYQRTYSWTENECEQLWDDVIRAGQNENVSVHFVGSIVYIQANHFQVTQDVPLLIIDGQQRLTTVTLMIAALAEAVCDEEPLDGFSARKLQNYYLFNPEETGDRHFKLVLSQTDKDSLIAIIEGEPKPATHSLRIFKNYQFFQNKIQSHKADLSGICKGLAKLMIVDIALTRGEDNPQLIFESMNSTGKELSQADLIRNYILMGLEPELQKRHYERYWRPMELGFGQEAYNDYFDGFMRHYLTVKTGGNIPKLDEVYLAFKEYTKNSNMAPGDESLIKDLHQFSTYYCAMALSKESDTDLRHAFDDLREMRVDVSYPFLLELYHDYQSAILSKNDFLEAVRLIESYVFRRAICSIPTNSLNKTFANIGKLLKKDRYLESIAVHLLSLPSYRRFPNNEEFSQALLTRDLYNFPRRSYWLRRLENHGRKERVAVEDYTIEHIMPQNANLTAAWKSALGDEWERIQQTWLHTLGNLTLTGYNSEYSDRPFSEKRDMAGGFKSSPLKLNQGLGQTDVWNEEAIKQRAIPLAKAMVSVWSAPKISAEIMSAYRDKAALRMPYTSSDHPHLSTPLVKELFEALSKEILALDPCVSQEFLKLYIAFKAETNFVDIVPQAKALRLSLNMPFSELHDPKNLCKDVSDIGRWGNGDVEIKLSSLDDLTYVMGLVRQALERQLGNNGDI